MWVNVRVKDGSTWCGRLPEAHLKLQKKKGPYHNQIGGLIDGAVNPASEPENIDVHKPQSDPSDSNKLDNEDVVIPMEALAQADEALQVYFHTLKTDDLPLSIP